MTLHRMRDCAEEIGLRSRAVRVDLEELRQLRTPAILHWNLDHFVVLKSTHRGGATIVDPAFGLRRLPLTEMSRRFTGVALEIAPTPSFQSKEQNETVKLSSFLSVFRGLGRQLGVVFAMTLLLQAFALLMPLNTQFTVDQGIRQGDMNIVLVLAVGFGLVIAISAITSYTRSLLVLYIGNSSAFRMVSSLAHHMMRLPDSWFSARHTGDILSRFGSTTPIRQFLMTGGFSMVVDVLLAIGALGILLTYSWHMTLAIGGFVVAFAGLNAATYRPLRNLTHESIAAGALENSSFIENIERHRAIKLLGAEALRENAWGERYVESINAGARLSRFGAHVGLVGDLIGGIESVVILLLGAQKVIDGEFTLGMLFAFLSYGAMFSVRTNSLIDSLVGLRMLRLHQERIADIGLESREMPAANRGIRHDLRGSVEIRSLSFAYNDEEGTVFDKLDLTVSPGEFIAIEGESGGGKSTLIKLLCKLLVPTDGQILIDGIDLARLDTNHYRHQLGVVMQDDDLFSGSLIENIAVSTGNPDLKRVEWAARMACIHDDIERMPMQYLTLVGHMGSSLSGGQRQRVMIARAIYRKPHLLLLDEGTAHLNDRLQQQVLTNLMDLDATIFAVTHDTRVVERAVRTVDLLSLKRNRSR